MSNPTPEFVRKHIATATKLSYIAYAGSFFSLPFLVEQVVKTRLKQFAPDQEVVWGPVACRSKLLDLFTTALVYVVKDTGSSTEAPEYSVVFRGTNALSWTSVFLQDLMLNTQVPWSVASINSAGKNNQVDAGAAVVSSGANLTLGLLKKVKSDGKSLTEFLMGELQDNRCTITFTGHSLGGLSAMMFPAWLINECAANSVDVNQRLQIIALAAPTPGDLRFAQYINDLYQQHGCDYVRIVNDLDMVNIAWSDDTMADKLAALYLPDIVPGKTERGIMNTFYNLASDCDYAQTPTMHSVVIPSRIMKLPAAPVFDALQDFKQFLIGADQLPLEWLTQALAQHIFSYPQYYLSDKDSDALMNSLRTEFRVMNGMRGLGCEYLRKGYTERFTSVA